MFTGLIEEKGKIISIKNSTNSKVFQIEADIIFSDLKLGDSVSVNGVCLTVSKIFKNSFFADIMHESLNKSALGNLKIKSIVNLERAMSVGSRFGGHIVTGHIDGVGIIKAIEKDDNAVWYTIETESHITDLIVNKGLITVDGMSLTVASVKDKEFKVSIIPHTREVTNIKMLKVNDKVNLENDILGKYVQKALLISKNEKNIKEEKVEKKESKLSLNFLLENGF